MSFLENILFVIILVIGGGYFAINVKKLIRNIKLGRAVDRSDNPLARLKNMTLVAFGQQKMFKRPIPAILHFALYFAFVITQIELIEIIIDGIFGKKKKKQRK